MDKKGFIDFEKIKNIFNKKLLWIVAPIATVAIIGACSVIFVNSQVNKWENKIYPNVIVEGVNLGGKTKEEALKIMEENITKEYSGKKIIVKAEDNEYEFEIDVNALEKNSQDIIEKAEQYGKDKGLFSKYKMIKEKEEVNFDLEFALNDEEINRIATEVKDKVNTDPKDATIKLSNGNFNITDDIVGKVVNEEKIKEDIKEAFKSKDGDSYSITAEVENTNARITADELRKINKKVSTFTTKFGTSDAGRVTNVSLAAKTLNGIMLMPGDEFSFNNIVGDTTADKGYQPATVIVGTKFEKDYGGGICQVSTTLYNAVMQLNIRATERHPHNMAVSYVDKSTDAAIAYGYQDYKFKNTLSYPIYIEGYTNNGTLTFNIYSNEGAVTSGVSYKMRGEITETVQPSVTRENDDTLEIGEEKVESNGTVGYKSIGYLDKIVNGQVVSSEKINTDYYKPSDTIIKVGTKEKE
ncbi:VanW family protein [Clostridium bornimense]|uniref:VanW family protein n=1 Tax=Clostridium bornimense TaxID=1216932 RepID=W6S5K7_9CLOT|nr:VanW family protein [Clostridium bornimense]CDM69632.1 VanW family protein [Clostridium bornimense]